MWLSLSSFWKPRPLGLTLAALGRLLSHVPKDAVVKAK